MTAIKQEDKIKPFDAGKVVEMSSGSSEEEFGDSSVKWGQDPTTSGTGSAAEQTKKTAKSTATIIREMKKSRMIYCNTFLTIKKKIDRTYLLHSDACSSFIFLSELRY